MLNQIPNGKEIVNPDTGEVVTTLEKVVDRALKGRADYIGSIFDQGFEKPIHMRIAESMKVTPKMLQSYVGVPVIPASEYKDQVISIIGAIPWFSGAFARDVETINGETEWSEGYHTLLLKISKTVERKIIIGDVVKKWHENIILKTSGKGVADLVSQMCETYGFFDFRDGFKFHAVISVDSKNKQYIQPLPEDFISEIEKQKE